MRMISDNHIALSRRNIMALLAKLDGNPPHSRCTIWKSFPPSEDDPDPSRKEIWVSAEEDDVHYKKTEYPTPGKLHISTENAIGPWGIY